MIVCNMGDREKEAEYFLNHEWDDYELDEDDDEMEDDECDYMN